MTNRIKELAEQAREEVSTTRNTSGQREMTWLPEAFERRFAELIVKAVFARIEEERYDVYEPVKEAVMKHFGVKQ